MYGHTDAKLPSTLDILLSTLDILLSTGSQALIGRFETNCIPWIPLVAEFGTDHIEKAVFVIGLARSYQIKLFCCS